MRADPDGGLLGASLAFAGPVVLGSVVAVRDQLPGEPLGVGIPLPGCWLGGGPRWPRRGRCRWPLSRQRRWPGTGSRARARVWSARRSGWVHRWHLHRACDPPATILVGGDRLAIGVNLAGHPGHPRAFGWRMRPICQGMWPTGIKYRTV
jgi:hypothetical protein